MLFDFCRNSSKLISCMAEYCQHLSAGVLKSTTRNKLHLRRPMTKLYLSSVFTITVAEFFSSNYLICLSLIAQKSVGKRDVRAVTMATQTRTRASPLGAAPVAPVLAPVLAPVAPRSRCPLRLTEAGDG